MFKKILSLVLVAVMCVGACVAFASCGDKKDEGMEDVLEPVELGAKFTVPADFKIGFICLHDENSTYDLNFINAAKKVQEHLGLKDEQVIIMTNVPEEGDDCFNKAEELVNRGCKVVFADSFGHEANMVKAAKKYPNVQFCHATGTKALVEESLSNFHNAFASIYEGRYLAGVAAGLKLNEMIEEKKITAEQAVIGYVGAFPYAEVVSGYTSFFLGARSVCPSATMKVRYTTAWYDYDAEMASAKTLIKEGCVLISQHADSMGAPTACETAGVPNVSYNGSTVKDCPDSFIISSAINWAPYYYYIIKSTVEGTAIDKNWTGTISTGSVILSGLNNKVAAKGTADELRKVAAELKAGTRHVFDTSKFTVDGKTVTTYLADVIDMGDYVGETEAIKDGYFNESAYRSAPYFDLRIDGITELNK